MPKMFVRSAEDAYSMAAREEIACTLTDLGIACERLSRSHQIRQGVWVFFDDYDRGASFSGGVEAAQGMVALVVYTLQGGMDDAAKSHFIAAATDVLKRLHTQGESVPVYVVIQEVPETGWGMEGATVSLAKLRDPSSEA